MGLVGFHWQGFIGMICRENVTCRGGFGISIGRREGIGELGYIAITLGGAKAELEEFFLENLIYFSCELITC